MSKQILITFCFIIFTTTFNGQSIESVTSDLDKAILSKEHFADIKKKRILAYRLKLISGMDAKQEYLINEKLYEEYSKFKIDSALFFIKRNVEIAASINNKYYLDRSSLQLANLYSSMGNYLESQEILQKFKSHKLPVDLKALYFEFYSRFYEHYTGNNSNKIYLDKIEVYRDSLLLVLNPATNKYKINLAQKYMYQKEFKKAGNLLQQMIDKSAKKDSDYAMSVYLLGDVYMREGKEEEGLKFYTLAAVTDIENAINDHGAIQNLAIYYYYHDKIDRAYKYAKSALEDAVYCNVKFRTLMMSEFYSIINASYQKKEAKSRAQLQFYLLLSVFLSIFLVVAVVYVYKQMKKVSKIKEKLFDSGQKLEVLNKELLNVNKQQQQFNQQLYESNRIKEEYIAQFFDICSSYIDKLDNYRRMLNKKALNKQYDELAAILKSRDLTDIELQVLYKKFDIIFINLYPTFVNDFNNLVVPEERILLREGEILNTELRIFALERLGITDGVKIASFLRYSISTIYNYRTKVRNKASVPREEFEKRLQRLGLENYDF